MEKGAPQPRKGSRRVGWGRPGTERTGLENRFRGDSNAGSNPALSVTFETIAAIRGWIGNLSGSRTQPV